MCKTIAGFFYVVTKYRLLLRSLFFSINNFLQEERLFHRKIIKLVVKYNGDCICNNFLSWHLKWALWCQAEETVSRICPPAHMNVLSSLFHNMHTVLEEVSLWVIVPKSNPVTKVLLLCLLIKHSGSLPRWMHLSCHSSSEDILRLLYGFRVSLGIWSPLTEVHEKKKFKIPKASVTLGDVIQ